MRTFSTAVHGHGTLTDLARKLKPAVDLIGKGNANLAVPAGSTGKIDTAKIAQIVGSQGELSGDVYKITIGRDDLKITDLATTR